MRSQWYLLKSRVFVSFVKLVLAKFPWFVKGLDSGLFHPEGLVRLVR